MEENGICSAAFCESAALWESACSPGGAVAQRLRGYKWRSEKSVKAIAPTGAALAFLCFDLCFRIVKGEQPLATGCGTQHPHRALGGTRVLLAAAPTTPPCFRRWRRSSSLHSSHFQRKNYFKFRDSGTPAGVPLSHFHRRGRKGKLPVSRCVPPREKVNRENPQIFPIYKL